MKEIEKAAKKCKIPTDIAKDIILREHELKYLYSRKSLVRMKIDIDKSTYKTLMRIATVLHVSFDAVAAAILAQEMEKRLCASSSK